MIRHSRSWLAAEEREQEEANRQTASLAGLAMALALVVIGVFLVRELHAKAMVEDCLLQSQLNCDAVAAAAQP
jgi:uncharacterized membrane protein